MLLNAKNFENIYSFHSFTAYFDLTLPLVNRLIEKTELKRSILNESESKVPSLKHLIFSIVNVKETRKYSDAKANKNK